MLFWACGKKKLSKNEMILFINNPENGFVAENKVNKINFKLKFEPEIYLLAKNEFDAENKIKPHHQFILNISVDGFNEEVFKYNLSSIKDYDNRIKYANSSLINDIILVNNNDTFLCKIHHYERSFGLNKGSNILFQFEDFNYLNGDLKIIYNDNIFNTGKQFFVFKEATLKNIPDLIYNL